ncbi:MAG: hypothetical protein IJV82_05910 [Oscillospiraceae bacterium]|nr:hypothetical protein [Oscillospiraceae bacterium]
MQKKRRKQKYKIVFRPGSPLTKLALLGVIVLSTVALIAIHCAIGRSREQAEALRAQAAAAEREQNQLNNKIDALGSTDSVIDIAGEELGLVDPDTVIFVTDGE